MKRKEVYNVIEGERHWQEAMKDKEESHVVEDFPLSSAMEAIRYNLEKANEKWYVNKAPFNEAMHHVRKIAAICIQMGEKYGMPPR